MANSYAELVFVRLVVPYIIGVLLFYPVSAMPVLFLLCIVLLTLLGGLAYFNLYYKQFNSRKIKPYITSFLYLLPLTVGGWITMLNKEILYADHFSKLPATYLEVIINDEPQVRGNILKFPVKVIRADSQNHYKTVKGHLMIAVKITDKQLHLNYGDQILIPAYYDSISTPKNPYEFDTKQWYSQQNVYHQTYLQPEQLVILKSHQGNPIIDWALKIRKQQVNLFRKLIKDDEAYTVASTLILGYRAELSEETLTAYSKTGTIHALSVSGMHVALIYLIIDFLLGFLDKWKSGKLIKLLLSICLIWLYALIAGFAPSVLRSVIMLSVFIIGNAFKRNKNSYNLLAFSAFCILIYNPLLIYDVGFQLSYLSVLGLLYLQPNIYAWFSFRYRWADKIWTFVALSLAAQFATFPLATYYFHQFPLYFLISNLFILLPVSLIMYLGLLISICPVEFLSPYFEWLLQFTNHGLNLISDLPYSTVSEIWFNKVELFLLSTSILCFSLAFSQFNKRLLLVCLVCFVVFSFSLTLKYHEDSTQRRIMFFSIQKGCVIAFIDKRKAWVFSTLAPDSKSIKYYVKPALDQAGIASICYIKPHSSINQSPLQMQNHQIIFFKQKILVVDSCYNERNLNGHFNFDAINIQKNANIDLDSLSKHVQAKMIFLDADRSSYHAERYKNVAKQFNLSIYDLKIKEAYLINLNQSL
jgi:competence protein ComEC